MTWLPTVLMAVSCLLAGAPTISCSSGNAASQAAQREMKKQRPVPVRTGESLDVILSAQAAVAWEVDSGELLYRKNETTSRPVASINKLLAALVIREALPVDRIIEIPPEVKKAQREGANIKLPVGEHASVGDLLAAGMIPSANDAMVALAVSADGSEEEFARHMNKYAVAHGLKDTVAANATGLNGGVQHSTALDVKKLLTLAYSDDFLRAFLNAPEGVLTTVEGSRREYKSTDKLLKTYLPIMAAKTGYTVQAGENLVIMTSGAQGQRIGAVILGSSDRFQDMKVLVEWIWRNYSWRVE